MSSAPEFFGRLQELTKGQLSPARRYALVALVLVALTMSALLAALLVGEPMLPLRTRFAFLAMLGVGLTWAGYGAWALRTRRVLLVAQQWVAVRIAVAFCAAFTLAALGLGLCGDRPSLLGAAGVGLLQTGAAILLLIRVQRRRQALRERLRALEAPLAESGR